MLLVQHFFKIVFLRKGCYIAWGDCMIGGTWERMGKEKFA